MEIQKLKEWFKLQPKVGTKPALNNWPQTYASTYLTINMTPIFNKFLVRLHEEYPHHYNFEETTCKFITTKLSIVLKLGSSSVLINNVYVLHYI